MKTYPIKDNEEIEIATLQINRISKPVVELRILQNSKQLTPNMPFKYTFFKNTTDMGKLIKVLKTALDLKPKNAERIVLKLCNFIEKEGLPPYKTKLKEFDNEHHKKAMDILTNKKPLAYIQKFVSKYHVGDNELVPLPFLSAVGLGLDEKVKVNLNTAGAPGKGKTDLKFMALLCMPQDNYEFLLDLSPKSFHYTPAEFFDNKIIYIDEKDKLSEDSMISLRVLCWTKERGIKDPVALTVKDQEPLLLKPKNTNTVVWMSGVETLKDEQLLSRFIVTAVDASKEQDKKVLEHQKEQTTRPEHNANNEDFKVIKAMMSILINEKDRVLLPYANYIDFRIYQDRRNFPIFKNLVFACAKFHKYQRPRICINNKNYIFATREDFEVARHIYIKIIATQTFKLTKNDINILKVIPDYEEGVWGITRKDIGNKVQLSVTTLTECCERLAKLNLISYSNEVDRKGRYYYWRLPVYQDISDKMKMPVSLNWSKYTYERFLEYLNKINLVIDNSEDIYKKLLEDRKIDDFIDEHIPMPDEVRQVMGDGELAKKVHRETVKKQIDKGINPFKVRYDVDKDTGEIIERYEDEDWVLDDEKRDEFFEHYVSDVDIEEKNKHDAIEAEKVRLADEKIERERENTLHKMAEDARREHEKTKNEMRDDKNEI